MLRVALCIGCACTVSLAAQQCPRVSVEVLDTERAAIPAAHIAIDGRAAGATDAHGRYVGPCATAATYRVRVEAAGFAALTTTVGTASSVSVTLKPATVQTTVDAVDDTTVTNESVAGTKELKAAEIKQLADDPDEFARQLQVLAAAAGGSPGSAIITVDGFQNSSRIPPKSAIALIRVNPDLFSAEYDQPPYRGGRVEIYTKPGQGHLHGALFTTQSAGWMNAADPFSPSKAAIGKQRYGFELGGPIYKDRADYFLALEHRQINQFAVVNAVVLDSNAQPQQITANVATPQSLWEASARLGLLISAHNNLTATYTATVNSLSNVGAGGTTLQQASYNSAQSEHSVRITNLQTISATLVHESRLGLTLRLRNDTPLSTAPQLQVAGAFTGGGVTTQALHSHELDTEFDDDILLQHRKHNLKAGVQLLNASFDDRLPTGFNGTYIFGGGIAPVLNSNGTASGQSTVISGLEQYRRALLTLPGGTPTQYAVTTGSEAVQLNQFRIALYAQDQWKLRPRLELSGGLRWAVQTSPTSVHNIAPRVGIAWSPDRKQRWVFHVRSGLFFTPTASSTALEALRLNGINQTQLQISNPQYGNPLTTGTSLVTTLRAPLPHIAQVPSAQTHFGVEHDFPQHWHAQVNLYLARSWDDLRSRNINAPLPTGSISSPDAPRPGAPDLNLFQYQQSGNFGGHVLFAGVDQRSYKKLQLFAGYIRMDFRTDADSDNLFPQSSYSNAGEFSRPSWAATNQFIAFTNYVLPLGVVWSNQFNAASGLPFNVTTGFDNNGDGVFNDRPRFANPGDADPIATPFGTLASTGTGAVLQRNIGSLPWNVHLDSNLSRSFKLPGEERSLAVNLRSTNLLNHTNVTAVGGVLGSPLFNQAYAADPGRRVEVGLRYAF